jgi:hypothetical protein
LRELEIWNMSSFRGVLARKAESRASSLDSGSAPPASIADRRRIPE